MSIEYISLENTKKGGIFTLRIENDNLSFNHTLIHEKEEYEAFEINDFGFELIKGMKIYHINGQIITYDEFKFVRNVIRDM